MRYFPHIRNRFGLLFLIILLSVMSAGIIKPGFSLLGWDNFSSYLNPQSSLFNTVFATWREHRGLGVPSDAEVTDIFRQGFSYVLSFAVGKELVDQCYFVLMLWGGILGIYALGRYVSRQLSHPPGIQELFGFAAAFFYLFNLNTLAVFYYPMIMFVTRFFMLPTTILGLLELSDGKKRSLGRTLFWVAVFLIGTGSFMVPTVFVTFLIVLGLMTLILKPSKTLLGTIGFYLFLNAFWILPFINYTVQKGPIVPEAPTFIEINEAMLNKPESYYSFERQSKLRPSFFETEFTNNISGMFQNLHPLARSNEQGATRIILWIFPIMYLGGCVLALITRKHRLILWFGAVTIAFLLFSMKDYSPVGILYRFISDTVPFANTIFRFGDTKFHAFVAFGGSIMAAYLLTETAVRLNRSMKMPVVRAGMGIALTGIIGIHLFPYASYISGNVVGYFMYNIIPPAYAELARIINDDPEPVRVIHLPFDEHTYWKPYTWGYFGSSFLHFMLNKPLFDRSFEPASPENADIHKQIIGLLHGASAAPSDSLLTDRADALYRLLKAQSVKYIIDDQSISVTSEARNITYWGTIQPADSGRVLSSLQDRGYLKLIKQFHIDSDEYKQAYGKVYPYNIPTSGDEFFPHSVNLYELTDPEPRAQLLSSVSPVNSRQTFLPPDITARLGHTIQDPHFDDRAILFPFNYEPIQPKADNGFLSYDLPFRLDAGNYLFRPGSTPAAPTRLMTVSVQLQDTAVRVFLEPVSVPILPGADSAPTNQGIFVDLPTQERQNLLVNISGATMEIPENAGSTRTTLGTVMVRTSPVMVGILSADRNDVISSHLIQMHPNPECLNDGIGDHTASISGENGMLRLSAKNISTCFSTTADLTGLKKVDAGPYAQLSFSASASVTSGPKKKWSMEKQYVTDFIQELPNPLSMDVCIHGVSSDICENRLKFVSLNPTATRYTIPVSGDLSREKTVIDLIVRSIQQQEYAVTLSDISLTAFRTIVSRSVPIPPTPDETAFTVRTPLTLSPVIPVGLSEYTQLIRLPQDGMMLRKEDICDGPGSIQRLASMQDGMVSLVGNTVGLSCRNFLQRTIPYNSANYYAWITRYKHLSGNIPTLLVMDKLNLTAYKKLYPMHLPANKYYEVPFQGPETVLTTENAIASSLQDAPFYAVGGFIPPASDLQDTADKELILQHWSENLGIIDLSVLGLIELPNTWIASSIAPEHFAPIQFRHTDEPVRLTRVFPSLWSASVTVNESGAHLLKWNESYDKQWIILNVRSSKHARCDGYANCYSIDLPAGTHTVWLLYIPGLFAFVGWITTILTIWFVARHRNTDPIR